MRARLFSVMVAGLWTTFAAAQEPFEPVAPHRWWAHGEFLLWRIKNDVTPYPLVTTGPAGDPAAGTLGHATTTTLYGDQLDYRLNGGARFTLGRWFDDQQQLGLEFTGFCLETHTIHGEFESNRTNGDPVIARPFFNATTRQPDVHTITSSQDALGGSYLGGIDIFGDSRTWGGTVNFVNVLSDSPTWRVEELVGIRFLGQKDQLRFSQSSTVLTPGAVGFGGASAPPPDIVSLRDYFETTNYYYGIQAGFRGKAAWGRWLLDLSGTIGPGAIDQRQEISGHTLLTDSTGFTQRIQGGLYATPDIVGHHDRWQFSWATEVNVRLGFAVTPQCQLDVGYSFLYWDRVLRPGNQLPLAVDPRQVPTDLAYTGPHPAKEPYTRSGDFWAQGISFGLSFRF